MASAEYLRKQAEMSRLKAKSIDEAENAKSFREQATAADERSKKYAQQANHDDVGEVIVGIVMVVVAIASVVSYFG